MNGRISLDTNIVIKLFKNDPHITKLLTSSTQVLSEFSQYVANVKADLVKKG